jgi:hypothetical protein
MIAGRVVEDELLLILKIDFGLNFEPRHQIRHGYDYIQTLFHQLRLQESVHCRHKRG